jgi:CDP-diacylglycerol--glycerol-3-phosphate 3-phosphatidyltransferase
MYERMNIPNQLTIARFWMAGILLICLSQENGILYSIALGLFMAAMATDALDGWLARNKYGCTTFGKLMDPLADKVLVAVAFMGLAEQGVYATWMVALIIAREFMVTGLRLLLVEKQVVLAADRWGKVKTVLQMSAILLGLFGLVGNTFGWFSAEPALFFWVGLVTVLITLLSGTLYFYRNKAHIISKDTM